jgi:hypothetical protein
MGIYFLRFRGLLISDVALSGCYLHGIWFTVAGSMPGQAQRSEIFLRRVAISAASMSNDRITTSHHLSEFFIGRLSMLPAYHINTGPVREFLRLLDAYPLIADSQHSKKPANDSPSPC